MGTLALVALLALTPVKVTITAPTHTPKVNVHWNYTVRVTENGKLVRARITEQIVDPIGGHHPVQFGRSTKNITNWPIKGVFRDYIIWPPESRGIALKLHVIAKVGTKVFTANYVVTPHG